MRTRIVIGLLALLVALAPGCKKSSIEEPDKSESDEQDTAQRALAKAQTEALDEIRAEIATWRSTAAAQQAEPDFKEDLYVARRLVGRLSKQASKEQDDEAALTVARLTRCLSALAASAPANRIQQHLERAEMALTSGDLEAAGTEVLAAAGTAYNPSAPALVPDVLSQLEEASKAIRDGDASEATELLGKVMETTAEDQTAGDLADAHLTSLEAQRSVERKSWAILIAQATAMTTVLNRVEKRATPEAKPETPDEGEEQDADEAETQASPAPETEAPEAEAEKPVEEAEPADKAKPADEGAAEAGEEKPEADSST